MLEKIVEFSVQRRGIVLIVWAAIFAGALASIPEAVCRRGPGRHQRPGVGDDQRPGLSPVEVEQYLTFPIETAMNGLPGVEEIRSVSRTAVSAVTSSSRKGRTCGSRAKW